MFQCLQWPLSLCQIIGLAEDYSESQALVRGVRSTCCNHRIFRLCRARQCILCLPPCNYLRPTEAHSPCACRRPMHLSQWMRVRALDLWTRLGFARETFAVVACLGHCVFAGPGLVRRASGVPDALQSGHHPNRGLFHLEVISRFRLAHGTLRYARIESHVHFRIAVAKARHAKQMRASVHPGLRG